MEQHCMNLFPTDLYSSAMAHKLNMHAQLVLEYLVLTTVGNNYTIRYLETIPKFPSQYSSLRKSGLVRIRNYYSFVKPFLYVYQ